MENFATLLSTFTLTLHAQGKSREQDEAWTVVSLKTKCVPVWCCSVATASFPAVPFLSPSPRLRATGSLLLLLGSVSAFNCDSLVMLVLFYVPRPSLELSCLYYLRIDCQTGTQSLDMQHSLPVITNHTEASRHSFLLSLNSASHHKLTSSIQIFRQLQQLITFGPNVRWSPDIFGNNKNHL